MQRLLDTIRTTWSRWLVIVVSDHDMEERSAAEGVDPMSLPGIDAIAEDWMEDGGSCWLKLRPGVDAADVDRVLSTRPEATGWRLYRDRVLLMGHPGVAWHAGAVPLLGIHGGPATRRTVAIVGGGHTSVGPLARRVNAGAPELRDWAPTVVGLLGIRLPSADGRDLLSEPSDPG